MSRENLKRISAAGKILSRIGALKFFN